MLDNNVSAQHYMEEAAGKQCLAANSAGPQSNLVMAGSLQAS